MENKNEILRKIPKVDDLLMHESLLAFTKKAPHLIISESAREVVDEYRNKVLAGEVSEALEIEAFLCTIAERIEAKMTPDLIPVINGTGIILHTNLGRANLNEAAAEYVKKIAMGYSTLEYNKDTGRRGSRYDHVEEIIKKLTGAEAALVVNNNAAAVLLCLSALAAGKEVVVSRGELVEIGGSFRVSEIMAQGGAVLKEVGTTNKTHARDYENALTENTGALLKVHTSNFKTIGFTSEVSVSQMKEIAEKSGREIPVIHDLGSGIMVDLHELGIHDEPSVIESFAQNPDVLSFSGDKLLGGPQAGIIIGKKEYIEKMRKHPLTRAFRIDKMTLAALEATFREYLDIDSARKNIPTLRMLFCTQEELAAKAGKLTDEIKKSKASEAFSLAVVETRGEVGGGSVPGVEIQSYAVEIFSDKISPNEVEKAMRGYKIPIIGRIYKDKYMLDIRTIEEEQFSVICNALEENFA